MIALLNEGKYFVNQETNDVKDFLISYASWIGLDVKIFIILVNSNELTTEELIKYINDNCGYNEEICEIFEIKNKKY